jgi:hypothetical protein
MRKDINGRAPAGAPVALALELHQARRKAHQLGVAFLQTELQLAAAFLDLAETTSNAAASQRNRLNTAKALDAVARFIETLNPEPRQRQLLMIRMAELRARLLDMGLRLQANGSPKDKDPRSQQSL